MAISNVLMRKSARAKKTNGQNLISIGSLINRQNWNYKLINYNYKIGAKIGKEMGRLIAYPCLAFFAIRLLCLPFLGRWGQTESLRLTSQLRTRLYGTIGMCPEYTPCSFQLLGLPRQLYVRRTWGRYPLSASAIPSELVVPVLVNAAYILRVWRYNRVYRLHTLRVLLS